MDIMSWGKGERINLFDKYFFAIFCNISLYNLAFKINYYHLFCCAFVIDKTAL